MTTLIEAKYYASSKGLEAKGPSCVTVEIDLYTNIPKSIKGANREMQTRSDCKKETPAQETVFHSLRWGLGMIF